MHWTHFGCSVLSLKLGICSDQKEIFFFSIYWWKDATANCTVSTFGESIFVAHQFSFVALSWPRRNRLRVWKFTDLYYRYTRSVWQFFWLWTEQKIELFSFIGWGNFSAWYSTNKNIFEQNNQFQFCCFCELNSLRGRINIISAISFGATLQLRLTDY